MTKTKIPAMFALAAALSSAVSCHPARAQTPNDTSPSSFTMRLEASVGRPMEISAPIITLALACCDSDGNCVWVDFFSQCASEFDVFYCHTGQSNADGSITCYD